MNLPLFCLLDTSQIRVGADAKALGVGADHVVVATGMYVNGANRLLILDDVHVHKRSSGNLLKNNTK